MIQKIIQLAVMLHIIGMTLLIEGKFLNTQIYFEKALPKFIIITVI